MYLGSAWYPEHWDETRWTRDLELMREAGMNVARIGEYAWCRLEPQEGRFELDWLERVIDLAAEYGVAVVLGTPSDAPPAWLTQKYPEVLRKDEHGRLCQHGSRRHFSPASAKYRELSAKVAGKMAERFGKHPNVLGWQIGNEYCWISFDEETRRMFQSWLKDKYGSLEALNARWTSSYWSQEYTDWSQIQLPIGWNNPCISLEWHRFWTKVFCDFQQYQVEAIRKFSEPRQWITHNAHNYNDIDFAEVLKDLDVVSWDPYPGGAPIDFTRFGWRSDFMRTLNDRPHWIMEMQPGRVNWQPPNRDLHRGEARNMIWHFMGHGAEGGMFWQWRPGPGTHEQYHGSIVAADGEPRPFYYEVAQAGREMKTASPYLDGTHTQGQMALVFGFEEIWSLDPQRHHDRWDTLAHHQNYYAAFRRKGLEVDVIEKCRHWESYPLVVAPTMHLLSEEMADRLVKYVQGGGHLVLGPRSGFKNEINALLQSRQPGPKLAQLLGMHIEDLYSLIEPVKLSGPLGEGVAELWSEQITLDAKDVEILLSFGKYNGWIDGLPAAVSRKVGSGRATYLSTCLQEPLMDAFTGWILKHAGISSIFPALPAPVECCQRIGTRGAVWVLINYSEEAQSVKLAASQYNVLTDKPTGLTLTLEPRGVAVLAENK